MFGSPDFGYVETHFDVAWRQHGQAPAGRRHHLARAKINLLHGAIDRAENAAARQPRLRRIEPRLRIAQNHFGGVIILLRAGAGFQQRRSAVVGLLRVGQRGLDLGKVGALQIIVDGEQFVAGFDHVAFAHRKRLSRGRPHRAQRR